MIHIILAIYSLGIVGYAVSVATDEIILVQKRNSPQKLYIYEYLFHGCLGMLLGFTVGLFWPITLIAINFEKLFTK